MPIEPHATNLRSCADAHDIDTWAERLRNPQVRADVCDERHALNPIVQRRSFEANSKDFVVLGCRSENEREPATSHSSQLEGEFSNFSPDSEMSPECASRYRSLSFDSAGTSGI